MCVCVDYVHNAQSKLFKWKSPTFESTYSITNIYVLVSCLRISAIHFAFHFWQLIFFVCFLFLSLPSFFFWPSCYHWISTIEQWKLIWSIKKLISLIESHGTHLNLSMCQMLIMYLIFFPYSIFTVWFSLLFFGHFQNFSIIQFNLNENKKNWRRHSTSMYARLHLTIFSKWMWSPLFIGLFGWYVYVFSIWKQRMNSQNDKCKQQAYRWSIDNVTKVSQFHDFDVKKRKQITREERSGKMNGNKNDIYVCTFVNLMMCATDIKWNERKRDRNQFNPSWGRLNVHDYFNLLQKRKGTTALAKSVKRKSELWKWSNEDRLRLSAKTMRTETVKKPHKLFK